MACCISLQTTWTLWPVVSGSRQLGPYGLLYQLADNLDPMARHSNCYRFDLAGKYDIMVRRISRYKCDLADNVDLMARRVTLPVTVRGTLATKKTPPRSRLKDATLSVENR